MEYNFMFDLLWAEAHPTDFKLSLKLYTVGLASANEK